MQHMHKLPKMHRTNQVQRQMGMSASQINLVIEPMLEVELKQTVKTMLPMPDLLQESSLIRMEGTRVEHTSSTLDHTPQMDDFRTVHTSNTLVPTPLMRVFRVVRTSHFLDLTLLGHSQCHFSIPRETTQTSSHSTCNMKNPFFRNSTLHPC